VNWENLLFEHFEEKEKRAKQNADDFCLEIELSKKEEYENELERERRTQKRKQQPQSKQTL
jgi:hypothetical protein